LSFWDEGGRREQDTVGCVGGARAGVCVEGGRSHDEDDRRRHRECDRGQDHQEVVEATPTAWSLSDGRRNAKLSRTVTLLLCNLSQRPLLVNGMVADRLFCAPDVAGAVAIGATGGKGPAHQRAGRGGDVDGHCKRFDLVPLSWASLHSLYP